MCENRWSSKMWALKTVTWSNERVHIPSCSMQPACMFIHLCTLKNICSEQFLRVLLLWTDPCWNCNEVSDSCGTFIDQFSWRSFKLQLWDSISETLTTLWSKWDHPYLAINIMHYDAIYLVFFSALHCLDLESSGSICACGSLRIQFPGELIFASSPAYAFVVRRLSGQWFRCRFTYLNLDKDCTWCEISNHLEVWEMSGKK